jgi:hypothetical protein
MGEGVSQTQIPDHAHDIDSSVCEWCDAPFPEAGPTLVARYDPDGDLFEVDVICSTCDQHGPPMSSRRDRREWASKLRNKWSRLERLGWWLIRRAQR